MKLSIRMDIRDFLSAAAKMSLEGRLPEFVAKRAEHVQSSLTRRKRAFGP